MSAPGYRVGCTLGHKKEDSAIFPSSEMKGYCGSIRLSLAELGVCKHKRPNHIGRTLPWLEVRVANRKIGRCNNLEQDHAGNHTALRMAASPSEANTVRTQTPTPDCYSWGNFRLFSSFHRCHPRCDT